MSAWYSEWSTWEGSEIIFCTGLVTVSSEIVCREGSCLTPFTFVAVCIRWDFSWTDKLPNQTDAIYQDTQWLHGRTGAFFSDQLQKPWVTVGNRGVVLLCSRHYLNLPAQHIVHVYTQVLVWTNLCYVGFVDNHRHVVTDKIWGKTPAPLFSLHWGWGGAHHTTKLWNSDL